MLAKVLTPLALFLSGAAATEVCDATRQMYQNSACCGGDGLSYCSSQAIDMTALTADLATVKSAVSSVELPPALSPSILVQSSPAFANSTKNLLFGCSSTGDTAIGTTLCQQYLNALLGIGTIDCLVEQSPEVVTNMANKAYEVFVDPSPTDTMVAVAAAGGFGDFSYDLIAARKRKGTVGYHGAAYFEKARFSDVTSEVVAGLESAALDAANTNTLKKLYDSAMTSRGKFVIGLGRLSSGSSSYSSFSVLKAAGIIDAAFAIQPAFAGTVIYHHNGDHDVNLWDLVHGRVDVAFTWEVAGMVVNEDGTFGPLTPELFEGQSDGSLASGNVEEVISPAQFIARFGVAAHTVGPIPNAPIAVLKDGIFAAEAAKHALVETISYAVNQDAAFALAAFADPPLINEFVRVASDFYAPWYESVTVVAGMNFTNVKQIVTLLIVDDGANKILRVPKGNKATRDVGASDNDIENVFQSSTGKVAPISTTGLSASDVESVVALGLTTLQTASGLSVAEYGRDPDSNWVQYVVTEA